MSRPALLLAAVALLGLAAWLFLRTPQQQPLTSVADAGRPDASPPLASAAAAPVPAKPGATPSTAPPASSPASASSPQQTWAQPSVPAPQPGVQPPASKSAPSLSREPQGKWATAVPPISEYSAGLPPAQQATLAEFQKAFPATDPTETQAFYESALAQRRALGTELTDATAAQYAAWMKRAEHMRQALVDARGTHIGIALAGTENGRSFRLAGFEGARPVYIFTQNVDAAISTGANLLRLNAAFDPFVGDTISGSGLYVSLTDLGTIYEHPEFQLPDSAGSRIILRQTGTDSDHASHCAGTIGAWGYDPTLIGMAPRVWLRSLVYPYNVVAGILDYGMRYPGETLDGGTANPRTGALQVRSAVGSTSLGATDSNTNRGVYTSDSAAWDQAMWDYPYYIEFYAAGNDGSGGTTFATLCEDQQIAKNITTIGNVWDVTRDASGNITGGGTIFGSSSLGPAFDGRIKPDLCGNGALLKSTTTDSGSLTFSGTSMATPDVAGSAVLLVDYYGKRFPGHFLRSSTLRALLVNAADDLGNAGPDYTFGWGMANVKKAGDIVKRYANSPASRVLVEDSLASGGSYSATYRYDGSGPIRVTLAWIDPPGTGQFASGATHTNALVNNLNLRLISPGGATNLPFVMPFVTGQGTNAAFSAALYTNAATTGTNTTDNIEQVYVASPPPGDYTLQVTVGNADGALTNGSQKFSLAVSGMAQTAAIAPTVTSVTPASGDGSDNFLLTVAGSGFLLGSDVILRRDGYPDAAAFGEEITTTQIACRVNTASLSRGRWDVVVRAPDGTETILPAAFLLPVSATLYFNDFTSATGLALDSGWAVGKPNYTSGGPTNAYSGTNILAYNLSGDYTDNMPARYAKTPAINCSASTKTRLSFQRWLGVERSWWDHADIQISTNGTTWSNVWTNPPLVTIQDNAWTSVSYDISAVADGKTNVYIRWVMGTTDVGGNYCGWNIDDVKVQGNSFALPPGFTSTAPTTTTIGQPFSYSITTSDADTPLASLTLTAAGLPAWMTFTPGANGTGTLTGTPPSLGNAAVTLSVTDGTYTTRQTVNLGILPVGGNTPPAISESMLPNAMLGFSYSATIHATDADGQTLALSNAARPAWLSFADNGDGTATFSGTPGAGTDGSFGIVVSVTDGIATVQKTLPLTVVNLDTPVVSVAVTDAACGESGFDAGVFTLSRIGGNTANAVTVNYAMSGTATNVTDYSSLSGSVTFAAGSTTATVTVTPVNDLDCEGPETAILTVSPGTGYIVGSLDSATITVADDDKPTVSVSESPASVLEGGGGNFTFSRTGPANYGNLVVAYTVGGTANPGADFPLPSGSFTIPDGQTSATLAVPASQDALTEPPETAILTLATNAAYTVASSPGNAATMTIQDAAGQPIVTIAATDNESSEPAFTKGNGTFTITRAGSAAQALTVGLVAGGTATSGSDYTTLPTSATIPSGQSTATVTVTPLDDSAAEPDETVTLTLQAGSGFTVGTAAAATVQLYDDEATQVRVEATDAKASENSTSDTGTFTLRRLGNRANAITVNYTMSGTATNGTDYTALTSPATIAADRASTALTVTQVNDALVEGTETVILTVNAGTGYTVAEPSSATVEMRDDETVDVNVTVQDSTCKEQATADPGSFRLTRSASSASPLNVIYTISGTATAGTDYTALSGTATIAAGATYTDVVVTPINDADREGTESVILTLALDGANYDLGDNRAQTLWIQDDDSPSISLAATDATAAEADGGAANPGQFTVTVTSAPASDLVIPFTVAGEATNGVDYAALSGSVTIPAGQTMATIPVDVVDDDIGEGSERVMLTLGQVSGYNLLTTGAATVNIAASDLPEANIVAADPSASENPVDAARFVVTLSKAPSASSTTIGYTLGGTATGGADYTKPSALLTFSSGLNTTNLVITPIDDSLAEGPETITATLAPSPNYTIGTNASATAMIADNESDGTQTLVVSRTSLNVPESGSASFTVSLGAAPAASTTVATAFQSGDTDLTVQSGASLAFTPANWSVPQTVTLSAAKDADTANGLATFHITSTGRPSVTVTATEMDSEGAPAIDIASPATGQVALPDLTDSLALAAVASGAPAAPSVAWSQVSGPSTAVFADATSASTSVTFPAAGTYVLRATATGNAQTATADLTVVAGGSGVALTGSNIGVIGLGGSFTATRTAFAVSGEGSDIAGTADKGYLLSAPVSGNFTISARVASQSNTHVWAKAGLMARQSTDTGSAYAAALITPTTANGVRFQSRATANGSTTEAGTTGIAPPYWLRVTRSGNTLSGWRSPDGQTWTQVGTNQTVTMTDPVLVGMVVCSHADNVLGTAVFDNITGMPSPNAAPQVNPGAAPAPNVGAPSVLAGTASDDSLPAGAPLSAAWSKISGPGTVTFGDAAAATSATFSAAGDYLLRLAANDGSTTVFQDLAVTVTGGGFESWIAQNPGTGLLTDPLDDPDHDGIPNLMEYALGGNPASGQSGVLPDVSTSDFGGSKYLTITFDRARSDVNYIVEVSPDLVEWTEIAFAPVAPGSSQTVIDNVALDASHPKRFMRLRVSPP